MRRGKVIPGSDNSEPTFWSSRLDPICLVDVTKPLVTGKAKCAGPSALAPDLAKLGKQLGYPAHHEGFVTDDGEQIVNSQQQMYLSTEDSCRPEAETIQSSPLPCSSTPVVRELGIRP